MSHKYWEICMIADPALYIPFRGGYPGSVRGENSLLLGESRATDEEHIEVAKKYAMDMFPKATIVAIWETNVLGVRKQQVYSKE